ncbi:MAG: SdrD B-like domain-containing protein [Candidatus Methanoperedens sp.]
MRVKTTVPTLLLTLVLVAASTISPIMGGYNDVTVGTESTVSSAGIITPSVTPGICGPIDLTIALDDTGSMGGAIANIKAELPTIISTATIASGGDLMVGYMTFKDLVHVRNNLTTNISAVMDSINATFAGGGAGGPESSDEAKNTSVNNLPAGTRPDAAGNLGTQIGNYTTPYRATATKIVVLITDAPPGGFNDIQDSADNIALNTTHPLAALAKGIKVSDVFVPTGGDYGGQAALLEKDANTTGGAFITTAANGSGTGAAITSVIEACGGAAPPKGSISGMKFDDLNGNGVKDMGEPGLENWTITLTNESSAVTTMMTDTSGNYSFTNLTAGNYTVEETLQSGWIQTAPAVSVTGSATYAVEISGGNNVADRDFGNFKLGEVHGMKFNDLNGNGVNNAEPGLGGWNITLTGGTGTMTTTTAADGSYSFTGLAAGTYTVAETMKPGWIQTMPSTVTYTVTITSGGVVNGQDFGNMLDIPQASCVKGPNPSGKNIPPANGGQRPDGFYQLLAMDILDPSPMVFVKDMGSGMVFGPYANGTKIKYTEANGATPVNKTIGGPNSAVSWHITGTGDAAVYAMNMFGTTSPEVFCLVPPPPK